MAKEKEEAKESESKKKSKGKLLIIIIAVVVLIAAGVAVKMFVLGGKKTEEAKPKEKKVEQQQQEQPPPQPQPEYGGGYVNQANLTPVVIGPLIVNLADVGGDRYLKIKLVLLEAGGKEEKKTESEANKTGINLQDAVIRDTIITVLSSKTSDDLLSVSGKEELKNELISAINNALHMPLVRKIYFLTFIIQ